VSRLFGRGELKTTILHVVADLGSANGYSIMLALADQIGSSWQPSPGAIYPALLGLQDAGLLTANDNGNSRTYTITQAGRGAIAGAPNPLDSIAARARSAPAPATTIGAVLDRLVAAAPQRDRTITTEDTEMLAMAFQPVVSEIHCIISKEAH